MTTKGWVIYCVALVVTAAAVFGVGGYSAGYREGRLSKQGQIAELQGELTTCELNYEQVIDVLNTQNIERGLPVDDQIANIIEGISDNGTIKYDVTLNFQIDDAGRESATITIGLKRGDKVDID